MQFTKKEEVIEQLQEISEYFMDEILGFLAYLKFKKQRTETALANEQVLAKDQ
ncbi:MAG: hypothetical protein HC880_18605 [Bacteroidia bacterium]|nr:hypothetical protein [Bacteroidia bacterium]